MSVLSVSLFVILYLQESGKPYTMSRTLLLLKNIVTVSNVLATQFICFVRQDSFIRVFGTFRSIDESLKKLNLHFSYGFLIRLTALVGFTSILIFSMSESINEYLLGVPFQVQFPRTISYYGGYFIRCVPMYYYIIFAALISIRLHYLTRAIEKWEIPEGNLEKTLNLVATIHNNFCLVSSSCNRVFVLAIIGSILLTIFSAFLLVVALMDGDNRWGEYAVWLLSNSATSWITIFTCQYATLKEKELGFALAAMDIPTSMVRENLLRCNILMQMLHRKISFNAAGLFNLDAKLILSHIGTMSVTTMFLYERKNRLG